MNQRLRRAVLVLVTLTSPVSADPQIWYVSSDKGAPRIIGINGAVELSLIEGCTPGRLVGPIENVDFRRGLDEPEGFHLRRTDGFVEYVNFEPKQIAKLSNVDRGSLIKLLTPKRNMIGADAR